MYRTPETRGEYTRVFLSPLELDNSTGLTHPACRELPLNIYVSLHETPQPLGISSLPSPLCPPAWAAVASILKLGGLLLFPTHTAFSEQSSDCHAPNENSLLPPDSAFSSFKMLHSVLNSDCLEVRETRSHYLSTT